MTTVGTRYRTGQKCEASGQYRFDGYTDGSSAPAPRPEEREIPLSRGETFPPHPLVLEGVLLGARAANLAAGPRLTSRAAPPPHNHRR